MLGMADAHLHFQRKVKETITHSKHIGNAHRFVVGVPHHHHCEAPILSVIHGLNMDASLRALSLYLMCHLRTLIRPRMMPDSKFVVLIVGQIDSVLSWIYYGKQ